MCVSAVTLADLCNMEGNRITQATYCGTRRATGSVRGHQWPQPPPSLLHKYWATWQTALTERFLTVGTKHYELSQPMGEWSVDPKAFSE